MQDIELFIHHHLALCLVMAIVLFALIIVEYINQRRSPSQLSVIQTTQMINRNDAKIVDIRSGETFSNGHIIGAVSLPFSELKEKINKLQKFKSQPIVIVCASGVESHRAAAVLKAEGYNTRILSGGIRSWMEADLPLVKD
jgi:rhodanese-related sulfurtransferase